jgi:tRNA (cmo5U34)-methyltransferase
MPEPSLIERAFGAERAQVYDDQFAPISAIKDIIHLAIRVHLAQLPDDARILLVGAGTGAEARFLAPLFPSWRFTLVDPAPAMLAIARTHAQDEGFAERCEFHVGYLDSAPQVEHHAALSVLVSHFLTDACARQVYFEQIAARLVPGGLLFNADLSADPEDPGYESVMDLWLGMLEHAGPMDRDAYLRVFGSIVGVHGPTEVQRIIVEAGFPDAAQCLQIAAIRGWVARRG